METLVGAALAVVVLGLLVVLAPRLGRPTSEERSKGLSFLQTFFGLLGIVLIAEWYLVEQPDAPRLKFDQTVSGAAIDRSKALVFIEISISNVGGHAYHFDKMPYKIFVQQVIPFPEKLRPMLMPLSNQLWPVWRADNWQGLAYRAVGSASSSGYPNWDACRSATDRKCDDGIEMTVDPGESENLYFAAVVPCTSGLHISISSRFQRRRHLFQIMTGMVPEYWIKQSVLDLTEACKPLRMEGEARK
jgi:hypothetical protein